MVPDDEDVLQVALTTPGIQQTVIAPPPPDIVTAVKPCDPNTCPNGCCDGQGWVGLPVSLSHR